MVDTQDLKSCNHCGCTSSSLVWGTKVNQIVSPNRIVGYGFIGCWTMNHRQVPVSRDEIATKFSKYGGLLF